MTYRKRDPGVEADLFDASLNLAGLRDRELTAFRRGALGRLDRGGSRLRVRPAMAFLLEALEEYEDAVAWALLAAQVDEHGQYADAIIRAGAHAARAHAELSRAIANRPPLELEELEP